MNLRKTILALSLIALSTTGCVNAFKSTRPFDLTVAWEDYDRIVVRSRNGSVSLEIGEGPEASIRGSKKARGATLDQADEHVEQVEIAAGADPANPATYLIELRYPDVLRGYSVGADFDIRIPRGCAAEIVTSNGGIVVRGMKGRVDLEASNGSITVADIAGPVEARTRNGRIRAERITGDLVADTSNGSVFASEITGDCTFTTSNGRIEVERIRGNVQAVTSNGTIQLEAVPPAGGRVEMRTSNGSIHVTLPADLAAGIRLRTSNGRIHTDFADAPITELSFGRNWFKGTLNGGDVGIVTARASNGSIRITCR
ncbi:MAG: DUF4097 family beta strand repeat protein [Planctomycetes bacterium]|nr:DUF4097 family beta strand repeat protein [Planctomycetota bacterium]